VTTPLEGLFVNPKANQYTKFEVSSLSRFKDILEGLKNLKCVT